jgi:hypothetical protein
MDGTPQNTATRPLGGATIDGMANPPAHAKPAHRKDHLWVLVLIAACALTAVWGSWLQIGDKSGFAPLGPLSTGWTPAVIVEAYWGYTLFAWLAGAPGRRSKRFAMWSFFAMFTLSLIGQASSHLTAHGRPPAAVVVFMSDLPVVVVACVAVLIHLRQLDRADAAEADRMRAEAERHAAQEAAAADERTALRAQLEDARAAVEPLMADLETARNELARVTAKADQFARKLAAASGAKRTAKSAANKTASSPRNKAQSSPPGTEIPNDVDTQAEALLILAAEPDISGSDLGLRLGKTKRYGQILKNKLAGSVAGPDNP